MVNGANHPQPRSGSGNFSTVERNGMSSSDESENGLQMRKYSVAQR